MRGWCLFLVVSLVLGVLGCKDDPMRQGMAAVLGGNADLAETSFKEVLKQDPKNLEARRMMAEVHRLKGDFHLAEEVLESLMNEQGEDLSPEAKTFRKRLEQQLTDLYTEWVESLDSSEDPEKFEAITRRGLKHSPRSTRLNTLLVEFYFEQSDRLIEKGDKIGAAEALENVSKYPGLPAQRSDAESRAKNLRLELFTEQVRKTVKERQAAWTAEGRWVEARKSLLKRVDVVLDRKLNPKTDGDLVEAQKAARPHVIEAIGELVREISGVEAPINSRALPPHHVQDEAFTRGSYSVSILVGVDDAIRLGFQSRPEETTNDQDVAKEKARETAPEEDKVNEIKKADAD